jgi:CheY-like chemotaxis protein
MPTRPTTNAEAPPFSLKAGAAHDLRNVLFVITSHCDRLLHDIDPADPRAADLHAMHDAAARAITLARQILCDLQKEDRAALPVDVNTVIRGVQGLVTRLAGDDVAVRMALASTPGPVTANAVQIEQIVMNLAVNARDAMPDGGRLTIATENRRTTAGLGAAAQSVVISVSDTGNGIDPAVQDRMFEPYFTTRAANGGTGVGLATVRAITLLHGGHVEVSSAAGQGTTFRVVLPRAESGVRREAPGPSPASVPVATKRILLVENERAIRDYLHRCLSAEGYDVRVAASGAEALHLCDPPVHPFDLVVTDVHLPDIAGSDVADRLRARWPEVGVVFMSGELDALEGLSDRGRVPVLAKPFTTSELVRTIRTVLTPPCP